MNIAEQVVLWEAKGAELRERQTAIMAKAADDSRTLDDDEQTEFDSIATEVKAVDDQVARLKSLEAEAGATAKPVEKTVSARPSVSPHIHVKKADPDDAFEGQSFTRRCIAKALSHMSDGEVSPGQFAEMRWGKTHPKLVEVIKAGVAGGGSGSGEWGAELVSLDSSYMGDFVEYLAGQTVYHQLPLREVPHNVTIKGQDGIGTGYWVGENNAIPVSAQDFSSVNLTPLKVAAISVLSNELIRDSSPSAEMLVRDGLVEAARQRVDTTFLGAGAAVADVSPAGILNGVTGTLASGTGADDLRADIKVLYAPFITAKNASGIYLVMDKSLAKSVSLMHNALGQPEFNNLTVDGGTLMGDPLVTGDNVTSGNFIAIKPSDIWRIGNMGAQVSISREATIEQDSAPAGESEGPTAPTGAMVSMFQTESTAFKVVVPMNYQKRRTSAVELIHTAAYA